MIAVSLRTVAHSLHCRKIAKGRVFTFKRDFFGTIGKCPNWLIDRLQFTVSAYLLAKSSTVSCKDNVHAANFSLLCDTIDVETQK